MLGGAALCDNSAPAVCIKMLCPQDPEFYTPLALNCQKGQHLPAPEVCKNQSSIFARNFPCDTVTGGCKMGATGSFCRGVEDAARHPCDIFFKLRGCAATLCARHCVARQGSQQWCDTKQKIGEPDADFSPCCFATTHFPAERSSQGRKSPPQRPPTPIKRVCVTVFGAVRANCPPSFL